MAKGLRLGNFEYAVLLALVRLGDGAYGAPIRREIEAQTEASVAIGAVHATLARLENKQLVTSWIGDPTPERGGKAKRHFRIEPLGVAALKRTRQTLERLQDGIVI